MSWKGIVVRKATVLNFDLTVSQVMSMSDDELCQYIDLVSAHVETVEEYDDRRPQRLALLCQNEWKRRIGSG